MEKEGVEELKRNEMRKGEQKQLSNYSTLRQKPGPIHNLLMFAKATLVLKTRRHGPSEALH